MKNQKISALILMKLSEGMSIKNAVDSVLGVGTFEKISGDIYESLRNKKSQESR